jgi:glycosyltransferase involved in cell wall biosynthesis
MGVDLRKYPFVPPAQHEGLSVLCVARLVPAKGLEVLVDAIGELCRRGRDVTAVIVGEGPLEGSLSRRAVELGLGERAHFAGAVGQEAMASYYAAADVFCLPSFAEGVPVVLMEAMATGRPVVTTRIAGIAELVEDGVSGVLVAPGNLAQLVAALERLAISPDLRANMSVAGRQRVEEQFDAVKCAHQVANMFRDMDRSAGIAGAPGP